MDKVIDLAVSERQAVQKQNEEIELEVQRRIQKHKNDLEKAHQKEIRAKSAMEKLESINSEQELEKAIQDIEEKQLNRKECEAEKFRLIKNLHKQHALTSKRKVV